MQPVTIASLMDIATLSGPVLSPDGKHAAYVVERQNYKKNRYDACIHLLDCGTGASRQMTFSGKESDPVWEDAHTLLFPAQRDEDDEPKKREKKSAFYRLDIRGGEARRAFEVPLKAEGLRPLGDGRFVVAAEVDLNAPPEDLDELLLKDWDDYHVIEEVPLWANGKRFVSGLRTALYLFDPGDGACKKLTPDRFNVEKFDIRGGRVLYAGQEYADVVTSYGEVRLYDVESEATRTLVAPGKYSVGEALLTDGGAALSLSTLEPWGTGQLHDWYRYDLSTGELRMAAMMDLYIGCAGVTDCAKGSGKSAVAVGEDVYFIAQREYRAEVCRLNADDTVETVVPFEGAALWLDADAKHVLFTAAAPDGLPEVYGTADGVAVRLTGHNEAYLREHDIAKAEYIPFTNADGVRIDGWVLKPAGFDPDERYPAVLEIHGGPRCAYGTLLVHEMQALCGAGYVVFFCNPRGSEGYGEAFADLRGRYGDIDFKDLMAFTDHVLEAVPQIDPKRVAACGGSYGGFMCNWIEGHTDRFAALASQRSISNWVSDYGSSEIGVTFDVNELGGDPWTAHDKMWAQSPLKYADRAKTPILFIHSLRDYNCTVDQGVEMFTAMKRFGVPARMCLFEGENHSLSRSGKPRHRVRRLEEIFGWFEKYLKA
ncbi:MAG: S9 family peptidase [Clostridia bacterium]|nr:S9 family peptidase [Clostridia bacterium]